MSRLSSIILLLLFLSNLLQAQGDKSQIGRNTLEVNVSHFANGTYLYGIRSNAGNCSFHSMVITK